MSIELSCACGRALRLKDELAGKTVKCPGCGSPLTVPAAEPAAESPAEPAAEAPAEPREGILARAKAGVAATVKAGKEEATRQARRAQLSLDLTSRKKELDEVYARIGERVAADPALQALANLPAVMQQIEALDAEIAAGEAELEELRGGEE